MVVEAAFVSVLAASLVGLALSVAIEQMMTPHPLLARPWAAWGLHAGLWLSAHALLTLVLGRPWFADAAVSAFLLMVVLVNNAKFQALREPFVLPDFEYFTDSFRHPRLYIPFLGWGKFFAAALGFAVAIAVGLWGEAVPAGRFAWTGQLGGVVILLAVATVLMIAGRLANLRVSFDLEHDVVTLGLLASLWCYAEESRDFPTMASPYDFLDCELDDGPLPHLVAVQSESFFDARALFSGIRNDVLVEFDRLKSDALVHGKLKVPAWGANTVRSEFAFLTGLDEAKLGVHRFNPYHAVAKGWDVSNLASFLKRLGYRTIAIHPYPASFYQRNCVYPKLGFDEFLDIRMFAGAERFGPYVSDLAVAEKIAEVLAEAEGPVFIFAITMENHGPLHLEKTAESDIAALYRQAPPADCEDLTIYLRHLCNAGRMIAALRQTLEACEQPAGLCWFGDHVPIMPSVYEKFGAPSGAVDYVLWSNHQAARNVARDIFAHSLPMVWLQVTGIVGSLKHGRHETGALQLSGNSQEESVETREIARNFQHHLES